MSDELVIVFVNNPNLNDSTARYLGDLNLLELKASERPVAAVMPDMTARFCDETDVPANADLLLVIDSRIKEGSGTEKILENAVPQKDTVFAFFHISSGHLNNQKEAVKRLCGGKTLRTLEQNSTQGSVFDALLTIGQAVKGRNAAEYEAAVRGLRALFAGEPELEVRLDLLHKCLTVEGAAEALRALSDGKSPALKNLAGKEVTLSAGAAPWQVVDVVRALARAADADEAKRITFSDEFDGGYLRALTGLRDALLSEMA